MFNPLKFAPGRSARIAGEFLVPSVRESVGGHAMQDNLPQIRINLPTEGPDAGLTGVAAVVVEDTLPYALHIGKEVMPHISTAQIVQYR